MAKIKNYRIDAVDSSSFMRFELPEVSFDLIKNNELKTI